MALATAATTQTAGAGPVTADARNPDTVSHSDAVRTTASQLIYFSSSSENTARFIRKLGIDAARIPLHSREPALVATEPYVLVLPTYGGTGGEGSVPKQVIRFLNDPRNRRTQDHDE